jgi:hypothetical protein
MNRIALAIALATVTAGCGGSSTKVRELAPEVRAQTQLTREMVSLIRQQQGTIERLMESAPRADTRVSEAIVINSAMEKKIIQAQQHELPEMNISPPLATALRSDLADQRVILDNAKEATSATASAATQAASQNAAADAVGQQAVTKGEQNEAAAEKSDKAVQKLQTENASLKAEVKNAQNSDLWTWFLISGGAITFGLFLAFATPIKKFGWYLALLGAVGCCVTYFFITVLQYLKWLIIASIFGVGIYGFLRLTGALKATGQGIEELKHDPEAPDSLLQKYFGSHGTVGRFHWLTSETEGVINWLRRKLGSEPVRTDSV